MDETPVEPQADAPAPLIPHPGAVDPGRFRVDDSDDDDPTLVGPGGSPVDTWRQGYPYDDRLSRAEYER